MLNKVITKPFLLIVLVIVIGYVYMLYSENSTLKNDLINSKKKNSESESFLYQLGENLKDSSDWDVIFEFNNNEKLYAHRTILKAHSKFFMNYFTNHNERVETINITDTTRDNFRFVIDLIYFGKFTQKPSVKSVQTIITYLDKYLIFEKHRQYVDHEFKLINYKPFIHESAGSIYLLCKEKGFRLCARSIQESVKDWKVQPFFNSTFVNQYSELFTDYLVNFC